jgi:hypothetical protein
MQDCVTVSEDRQAGRVVTHPGNNALHDKADALCRCGRKGTYLREEKIRTEPDHDRLRVVKSADRMATDGSMCRAFETLHRRSRLSYNWVRENFIVAAGDVHLRFVNALTVC